MLTQDFRADTIDQAAQEILKLLKEKIHATRSVTSRDSVFYFNGWDGLGASAVLRAVARRLTAPTSPAGQQRDPDEPEFDQVIHIDCSMWESRRALQRAVAEQLKLPDKVMELFDRQDEEDDFHGVAQGSRTELQQVVREMFQHIQKLNRRFLVIFHNGSNEEIDLANFCGFPLSGFSTSKVLWTFQGRFRLIPRGKFDMAIKSTGTTDAFLSATPFPLVDASESKFWSYLVRQEASDVVEACKLNTGPHGGIIDQPAQVVECFLYMLELCCSGRHSNDYDLAMHCANYWTCDGITQPLQQGKRDTIAAVAAEDGESDADRLWRAADALQREMRLDVDYHQDPPRHLAMCAERKPYWTSPTLGCILVPTGATPNRGMFQLYADKLSVLKLSRCTFNFQSPPFLCCHNLRFLWLDRCQGSDMIGTNGEGNEQDLHRCFQRLWVLDVRYTDCDQILSAQMLDVMSQLRVLNVMATRKWDIGQLKGRLPNIHKLRVTKSVVSCSGLENELFSKMNKMELLDFSENFTLSPMMSLSRLGVSNNIGFLETVIIVGGCHGYGIEHISFRGCNKLKSIFLRGSMLGLHTLDISGTAVKILDLTRTTIESLDELYLLGCEKLCAILWPPQYNMKPDLAKLCIDTALSTPSAQSREGGAKRDTSTATTGTSTTAPAVLHGSGPTSIFSWYLSVRDARLLMSIEPVYSSSRKAYVEVSSNAMGGSRYKGHKSSGISNGQRVLVYMQKHMSTIYTDITVDQLQQQGSDGEGDAPAGIMQMWPCPDVPHLLEKRCYIYIHDEMRTGLLGGEETSTITTVPKFAIDFGQILHVHDSLSITTLPLGTDYLGSEWHMLEWCRIERCPRLDCVFTPGGKRDGGYLYGLRTIWVSELLKARYIWKWSEPGFFRTFPELKVLHLDCCPRLIHVLPLSKVVIDNTRPSLNKLETLEITWCPDLREVFPLDTEATRYLEQNHQPVTLDFPNLKHIHLHELPSLQSIFGFRVRMSTPNLKTIKIRGCWSLTCLTDVSRSNKVVECDCEKEWWDSLQWDDGSLASRYKPIHSRYYKKTMLRSSVLR